MKVISGDFGENRSAVLCKTSGWIGGTGGTFDRVEIGSLFWKSFVIKANEIKSVQVIADNSKVVPGDLSGTTAGAVAGLVLAGPIGLAIGALVGSSSNKASSVDKSIAVLIHLTDGRQLLASCDLTEFGLLSAAASKKR